MSLLDLTFKELEEAKFELYAGNPVIRSGFFDPVIADPSVVTPDESHDGKWYLLAHSLVGVRVFSSDDGISFDKGKRVISRAMRADVKKIDGVYHIFYERLKPLLTRAKGLIGGKWESDIYAVTSKDLTHFSKPAPVLTVDKTYERTEKKGHSLSNPFLLGEEGGYRLYYSAGLTYIEDCGFSEPTYICLAESAEPLRGYVKYPAPIIYPDEQSRFFNLCCGCLKVYKLKDGYAGVQNGIYREDGKSKSAIQLLYSSDGVKFVFVKTLIEPRVCAESDWMAQFVYASHLVKTGNKLRLYFNARNKAYMLSGRENIGFAEAELGAGRVKR